MFTLLTWLRNNKLHKKRSASLPGIDRSGTIPVFTRGIGRDGHLDQSHIQVQGHSLCDYHPCDLRDFPPRRSAYDGLSWECRKGIMAELLSW